MSFEERQNRLLGLIEEFEKNECDRLLSRARNQARTMTRKAYEDARRRLHEVVLSERARARERIRTSQAELDRQHARHQHRKRGLLLEAVWPRLAAALERRWQNDEARLLWIRHFLSQARRQLFSGDWVILHPPDWGEPEQILCQDILGSESDIRFELDRNIDAGLTIERGGAVLDATVAGLLEDRQSVESHLLALLDEGTPE
jgi:hypothetical protein